MNLGEISGAVKRHAAGVHALRERVDYLVVAVGRGDPRFTRPEFAAAGFDADAFDREWAARGRRVPPIAEVLGAMIHSQETTR